MNSRAPGLLLLALAVALGARGLAYALAAPSPFGADLAAQEGGPSLAALAVAVPVLALALGAAVAALARVGVAERHRLSGEGAATAPAPLRLLPIARRALLLTAGSAVLFAALESYVHWRAGLGFHGLHCLLGPVHRDVLPFLLALSLIASAGLAAAGHVLAWLRRAAPVGAPASPLAARPALVLLPSAPPPARRAPARPGGLTRTAAAPGVRVNPST